MDQRNCIHHPWNLPLKRAAALQTELSSYVLLRPLKGIPEIVAGVDTAEWKDMVFIAVVVMEASTDKVIEITHGRAYAQFPYIAGYRAFRDGPPAIKALRSLRNAPDLVFIAGQGVCHPRFLGVASHLGLWIDRPTIGCTDRRLVGHYEPPGEKRGNYSVIRYSPQAPGVVLRTRDGVAPVFVSPGHRTDLLSAIENTLRFCTKYRLPEPLRRAHIEAGKDMRRYRDEHTI
jgi:deoxyribonuclease V